MVHTFEEIRTRTPANPNEAALEAAMPQALWEALLWHAVQGLRPPCTSKTLRRWLQTTQPKAWAIGAPQAPPPPHHHHTGEVKGKGRVRGKGARRGPRYQAGAHRDRAPEATQHGGKKPAKGQEKEWHRGRGRKGGHQGAHTGRARHNRRKTTAPPPADTARPPEAHAGQDGQPQHGPDAARGAPARNQRPPDPAQGTEGTPTRGAEATPTEGAAENAVTQPTTTPSPPGDDSGHNKGQHTSNGTGTRGGKGHGRDNQDGRRQGGRGTGLEGTEHT